MKVKSSKYFNRFYYKEKSLFIVELTVLAEEMTEDEYKKEILENVVLLKKFRPEKYLYDFSLIYYNPAGPVIQEWISQNSFKITNQFVKKQAIVSSNSILMKTSARQTLDEDESDSTIREIFESREEAEKWLFEK